MKNYSVLQCSQMLCNLKDVHKVTEPHRSKVNSLTNIKY